MNKIKVLKIIIHLFLIILLTFLTQVGGVIWIVTLLFSFFFKFKKRYTFIGLYLIFNILIIPPIASHFGRVKLPVFHDNLKPRNITYTLLFRNYVNLKLKTLLLKSAKKLENDNIQIIYLDANFPFYNGFPLLPHLSHNDGKKIDLSFMYLTKEGNATQKKPSLSGYGVFVKPNGNLTSNKCKIYGYWQYDFSKYLTFGTINKLQLDKKRTKQLLQELLSHHQTQKIFIEPYLKKNLSLENYHKIRFHGCQAVRHDDHIHLQIK